jgi:hypothetical protein
MLRGIGVGDHAPDIVADELHAPVAERGGERLDILRHRLLVVALGRLGGPADAAQIGCYDRTGPGQLGDERPPHVAGLGVAVQEEHRLAPAGGEIVKPCAVDVREAAFDGDRRLRLSGHGCAPLSGMRNPIRAAGESSAALAGMSNRFAKNPGQRWLRTISSVRATDLVLRGLRN